ncbi:MAG: exodeoxyribonuclease VII large subunit [Bacteroidales bacterium]|nr:exodeoxyribonuclease VII large subunit [Bacteroidales bacterium]
MPNQTVSLSELNDSIKNLLEGTFDFPLWVMAEIAEMKVAANGHCYLDLLEKTEKSGKDIARARATIWRNTFPLLKAYFEETTGQVLGNGLKVMLLVEVRFHSLYGYSLNVVDINPSFTLGEMALQREKILAELEKEGVLELNQQLDFPLLPQRIAVISSEGAAGYEDFLNELTNNADNYRFEVTLFPAVMQGEKTESSVVAALDEIYAQIDDFDVVAIIRGGGAKLDLSAFDNKLIAENVTQFPLPVLAGIGHTKDQTVLDIVSYQSLKTPTAVADFLIQQFRVQDEKIQELQENLQAVVNEILTGEQQNLQELYFSFKSGVGYRLQQEESRLLQFQENTRKQSGHLLAMEMQQLFYMPEKIHLIVHTIFSQKERLLDNQFDRLKRSVVLTMNQQQRQLENFMEKVKILKPENLLKRGYHLVTDDMGKIVKGMEQVEVDDMVQIHFTKGTAKTKVIQKQVKGK